MAESGILTEDDRVELIEGEIVEMTPIGSRHAACVKRLVKHLSSQREDVLLDVQNPLRLSDASEPEPDLLLLKARQDFYASAHPSARDVLLLIEVADTTLAYDRTIKVPLYARESVPEVWVVDLEGEKVWVHKKPSAEGYLEVRAALRGEALSPSLVPQVQLTVEQILV